LLQIDLSKFKTEDERNAFAELYQRYETGMYNIAYSILHDRFLAEDAVNDAFIKLIKYVPKIYDLESHKTKAFIAIIVKSTAIDIYRKRKKQYEYEVEEPSEVKGDDIMLLEHIIADEDYNELMINLKKLKKEYQEIILLKYKYGLSNIEISKLLRISESAVRQHICRAKKAVKKILEEKEN
jgi:RNA polymerase sigma-70 factor (ECF subfamily)